MDIIGFRYENCTTCTMASKEKELVKQTQCRRFWS